MKETSWELPQHPATPGETVKHPLCLMENPSCNKGVTCAFQVTSMWMSYSSPIVRRAWKALASGWFGSSGWEERGGFRTSLWCLSLLQLGLVTLVLLLDGQDALALLDQLHPAVGDEPDGQGAHGET